MQPQDLPVTPAPGPLPKKPVVKIVGVGGAGLTAVEHMARQGVGEAGFAAVHSDARLLGQCTLAEKLLLGASLTRGLGVGEPDVGRVVAEAEAHKLRQLCEGADLVILVGGLGGNTGSGVCPVLARVARDNGALVLALVALPFEFEGRRRQQQAEAALKPLKAAADAVIALPNQKVAGLIDDKTSLPEAMLIIDDLLAQGVRGLLRMMTRESLISVDFPDLCQVVRGRRAQSCFATAEAAGENRAREVVDKLKRSPLLENGRALAEADAVLVSLSGGPGLSLKEVHQVMEQINRLCEHAQVVMGAGVDNALEGRLAVTVIVSQRAAGEAPGDRLREAAAGAEPEPPTSEFPTGDAGPAAERGEGAGGGRASSRYVPPPPELTAEQAERILSGQSGGPLRRRRRVKPEQGLLPLEAVSKGRFAKSEPTIHRGEDLDTPTYIRRGMALN